MARMSDARWLGEHGSVLMTHYDIACVHTIVGYAPAHAAHFSVHGDGTIDQSRDTRYQSGANYRGNPRIIAIENEDHGTPFPSWSGSDVPALTPAQVEANGRILRWAHDTHGIPLQLCPNSLPTSQGLAYHRQGIDGNFTDGYPGRVPGGEVWTLHYGKVCPGWRRIPQLPDILAYAIGGTSTPEVPQVPEVPSDMSVDAVLTVPDDPGRRTYLVLDHSGKRAYKITAEAGLTSSQWWQAGRAAGLYPAVKAVTAETYDRALALVTQWGNNV